MKITTAVSTWLEDTGNIKALSEKQFPPEIISNFVNGFGYSWNLFYPPLSGYIISFAKLISADYIDSVKLSIVVCAFIAGINMFNLMKDILKKEKPAFLTSVIYITGTYFITDIFIRMNIGEIFAMAFLPMVLRGLYSMFCGDLRKHYYFTLGMSAIALSHTISTYISAGLCLILIIAGLLKNRKSIDKIYTYLILDTLFTIGIVSFFYAPFLETITSAKYRVMGSQTMATNDSFKSQILYLYQLMMGKPIYGWSLPLSKGIENEMIFSIGLHILVPLMLTPFVYKKIKREKRVYILITVLGIISALMTTNIWPWEYMSNIAKILQFPWRILMISSVLLTIIAGVNLSIIIGENDNKTHFLIILIICIYISNIISGIIRFDTNASDEFVYKTDLNMKVCGSNLEYLPEKSNSTYIINRNNSVIITSGNAKISNEEKNGSKFKFDIEDVGEKTEIELPFIYYPGYKATINGNSIKLKESENGFLLIQINQNEKGNVQVEYKGTIIQKLSFIISIISFIGFLYWNYKDSKDKTINK